MQITESFDINDSPEKVWNTISSFDQVERYVPLVSKSSIEKSGKALKRICNFVMGKQEFQTTETIEFIDNSNHFFISCLNEGPIQLRGMKFIYEVKSLDEGKAMITISTNVENPDAESLAKNFCAIIGQGLKKLHEN